MAETHGSRRRGAELENEILDAAWEQLVEHGWGRFTIEAVADRARTSKPVLYRRWADREELLKATLARRGAESAPDVPDTGNVRDDLIGALRHANSHRSNLGALISALMSSHFADIGLTPTQLRRMLVGDRRTSIEQILERAVERGEVDPDRLTPRIVDLPFTLFRHEYIMTFRPLSEEVLEEFIDDIVLPLIRPAHSSGARQ